MIQKFKFTFKLFHNSRNETKLGEVVYNTKTRHFKYDLENMDKLPDYIVKTVHKGIKAMIQNFNKDDESEQNKYPIRFDDDYALELIYRNAYK